jgi:hypothetical protein
MTSGDPLGPSRIISIKIATTVFLVGFCFGRRRSPLPAQLHPRLPASEFDAGSFQGPLKPP